MVCVYVGEEGRLSVCVCLGGGGEESRSSEQKGGGVGQPDANNGIYAAAAFFGLHVGI